MSYCCEKCFNDEVLKNKIIAQENKGICNYCNSKDVYVADTTLLTESFDYLLQYYKEPEAWLDYNPMKHQIYEIASPLIDLINDEWNIFSQEVKNKDNDEKLLIDIVDTYGNEPYRGLSVGDLFISIDPPNYLEEWEELWTDFKENLKHSNRFFPQSHDLVFNKYFDEVLNNRKMYLAVNLIIYRSRMGLQENDQMLAPPKHKATAGRANPHGISYLYCARDEETCIAEVRPWKEAIVTIAG
ncbi:hypothetical protein BSK59_21435 [Paenibacillus odorifer]|uniref:HEPN-associated N-terminal domain-containing protein n=1 Tax=Paenibacillus odorifer TaxID=189426 RepID=UPI00096CAFBC|nr:hypothetical protein BSK59_21435 [Paenibacillus odorifer]